MMIDYDDFNTEAERQQFERLIEENARLREENANLKSDFGRLKEDTARLRAALEKIAKGFGGHPAAVAAAAENAYREKVATKALNLCADKKEDK